MQKITQNSKQGPRQSSDGIIHGPNGYTTSSGQALNGNSLAQARASLGAMKAPLQSSAIPQQPQSSQNFAGQQIQNSPVANWMQQQQMPPMSRPSPSTVPNMPSSMAPGSFTGSPVSNMAPQFDQYSQAAMNQMQVANQGAMGGLPQSSLGQYQAPTTSQVFGQLQNNSTPWGYSS